jgi:hypothetical protein
VRKYLPFASLACFLQLPSTRVQAAVARAVALQAVALAPVRTHQLA